MSDITTHLGKTSQYKSTYDNTLLVREPRQRNRTYLDIQDENLPFVGYDIWNAFEVSMLLANGCPVSVIAKVTYSCDSKYIVESKSIKLYFNSFNMEKRDNINTLEEVSNSTILPLLKLTVLVLPLIFDFATVFDIKLIFSLLNVI